MTEDLLELALADPLRAEERARQLIATSEDAATLATAHQGLGIALRDQGQSAAALDELRTALTYARRVCRDRSADVRASLGVTLFLSGRTTDGLRALDRAAADSTGLLWAKVLMRRAGLLSLLGRQEAAAADMSLALDGIRGHDSPAWEARTLNNLGSILLALGRVDEAEDCFGQAERTFREQGLVEEAVHAVGNLGLASLVRGDLPQALTYYAGMSLEDVADGRMRVDLVKDQCRAFLSAGLAAEALTLFDQHLSDVELPDGAQADLDLAWATVTLASGDPTSALAAATRARQQYRRQHRVALELRAWLVQVQAKAERGDRRGLSLAARGGARRLDEA